jgi:hypothetical protein
MQLHDDFHLLNCSPSSSSFSSYLSYALSCPSSLIDTVSCLFFLPMLEHDEDFLGADTVPG